MKKILTLTAGTLLAGSCLFGVKPTLNHAKSVLSGLRAEAEEALPTAHHLEVARQELAEIETQLLEAEATGDEQTREGERLAAELAGLRQQNAAAKSRLSVLRPALAGGTAFVSGGCQYSHEDVASDAAELVAFIQRCQAAETAHEEALKQSRAAVDSTRNALNGNRAEFAAARGAVEALALKLKQEETIASVRDVTDAARGKVSGELKGELARTMALLEKRAATLSRRKAARTGELPHTRIPAVGNAVPGVLEKVDATRGNPPAAAPTAANSPSAVEAPKAA
jgi:hypothetical protein